MGIKDSSLWAREILSFLETAKNGSINGTAEANAMKQSNLSRTLKSLEEKLKCQLLESIALEYKGTGLRTIDQ